MTLTKDDLKAIDGLLAKRINPLQKRFDEMFNFLDKQYVKVKKDVRVVSEF